MKTRKILKKDLKFQIDPVSFQPLWGPLAQSVEQEAFNLCVVSSILTRPTIIIDSND